MGSQVVTQIIGVVATIVWCAVLTWIVLEVGGAVVGLRVADEIETQGLDLSEHDERGYIL